MEDINSTIEYYNQNADQFKNDTINADMHELQDWFLSYVKECSKILDLGCGTGRDSKYFLERGYRVTAVDGSSAICKIAKKNTGLDVRELLFEDLDYTNEFDAVWACASLLHVPYEELPIIFKKIGEALIPNGILYASFKKGEFQGQRNGRFYTDLTEESITDLLQQIGIYSNVEYRESFDVRPGRDEEIWINVIARKIGDHRINVK